MIPTLHWRDPGPAVLHPMGVPRAPTMGYPAPNGLVEPDHSQGS